MIKEALQYIIGLSQPRTEEIYGETYYFHNGIPMLVDGCRRCEPLEISTLTSLVDYIKERMAYDFNGTGDLPQMIVHVESETEVRLVTAFNDDMARWELAKVKARVPAIALNKFIDQESFIIQMQSMFKETPFCPFLIRKTNSMSGCSTSWNVRKGCKTTGFGTITSSTFASPVLIVACCETPSSP